MNIGMIGISTAVLFATLWIVAPASAQKAPPPPEGSARMMKDADTDKDGRISRAEADAQRSKAFSELDEDGDGAVSRDLFVSRKTDKIMKRMSRDRIESRVGRHFDDIDQDSNKTLSWDEYNSRGQSRFDRNDRDNDGFISQGEGRRHGFKGGKGRDGGGGFGKRR